MCVCGVSIKELNKIGSVSIYHLPELCMSIDAQTFSQYLKDLTYDMKMMFKGEYQCSSISPNPLLGEIDILMYNRIETSLQVVYNTYYASETTDKWTEIYKHLVGIRDSCCLRLIDSYWLKFEACMQYAGANTTKPTVAELLAAMRNQI